MLTCDLPPSAIVPGINLTRRETSTLVAIACYVASQEGDPMPLFELSRAAEAQHRAMESGADIDDLYRIDLTAPARLAKLGLIELLGPRTAHYYIPTPAALMRLQS